MKRPLLEEPLAVSAPLARRWAGELCRKDPATGGDCSWYHGLWQDLRSVGLAASPEHQAGFFLEAFQEVARRPGRKRVLISGAADYSILAYVLGACDENGVEADVTVLDRCETPLALNRWYAERLGKTISTVGGDIFHYEGALPFDVICSHSFLGQIFREKRPALIDRWARLLAPDGVIVTVNRVRPAGGPAELRFSPEEGRKFCETVSDRIGQMPGLTESDRKEILRRTRSYVEQSCTHAITSEEMVGLFERDGFQTGRVSSIVSTDEKNSDIGGKAVPKDAKHACLLVRKVATSTRR